MPTVNIEISAEEYEQYQAAKKSREEMEARERSGCKIPDGDKERCNYAETVLKHRALERGLGFRWWFATRMAKLRSALRSFWDRALVWIEETGFPAVHKASVMVIVFGSILGGVCCVGMVFKTELWFNFLWQIPAFLIIIFGIAYSGEVETKLGREAYNPPLGRALRNHLLVSLPTLISVIPILVLTFVYSVAPTNTYVGVVLDETTKRPVYHDFDKEWLIRDPMTVVPKMTFYSCGDWAPLKPVSYSSAGSDSVTVRMGKSEVVFKGSFNATRQRTSVVELYERKMTADDALKAYQLEFQSAFRAVVARVGKEYRDGKIIPPTEEDSAFVMPVDLVRAKIEKDLLLELQKIKVPSCSVIADGLFVQHERPPKRPVEIPLGERQLEK